MKSANNKMFDAHMFHHSIQKSKYYKAEDIK